MKISGIAASVISDQAPGKAPIVATCDGPRTRIYCVYDEEALDESNENESPLGYDPLNGDWEVSLPCEKDDLQWVQRALKQATSRVTARDVEAGISTNQESTKGTDERGLSVNIEELFRND
jgi:hypothetical protein